jgi:hypothetical protein
MAEITEKQVDDLYLKLKNDAQTGGYKLKTDIEFLKGLLPGVLVN